MKFQTQCSEENKKNISLCPLLKILSRVLSFKDVLLSFKKITTDKDPEKITHYQQYGSLRAISSGSAQFSKVYVLVHYKNTPIQIYRKFHLQKLKTSSDNKNSDTFPISAQKIDCGYSLDPPQQGSSNEYPQSMFLSRYKNKRPTGHGSLT